MASKQNKHFPVMPRRTAMRLAAGGAVGLVLAACGGGGGGGGSSGDVQALRDAYARLHDGMVWTDVEALVGFPANDFRMESKLRWIVSGVTLSIEFYTTNLAGKRLIASAVLIEVDGVNNQQRTFG